MNASDAIVVAAARSLARSHGPRIRAAAGLTIPEAAAAVGVAPSTLWRWEHSKRVPRGDAAIRYAELIYELADLAGVDHGGGD